MPSLWKDESFDLQLDKIPPVLQSKGIFINCMRGILWLLVFILIVRIGIFVSITSEFELPLTIRTFYVDMLMNQWRIASNTPL